MVVTGVAGTGCGRAIAVRVAESGAAVVASDILALDPGHEGARVALEKRLAEEPFQLVAAGILEPITG